MSKKTYQKSIGFSEDVFRELQRLKVTHSISMSLFVNNTTRKAIEELKKEIKKNEN